MNQFESWQQKAENLFDYKFIHSENKISAIPLTISYDQTQKWSEDILKLVDKAIDGPYIVQEYISSRRENVLMPEDIKSTMMNTTLAMYLIGGKSSGLLCRSSPQLTTNFYASGVFRPAFVIV
jgi:hypothetical protein